MSSSSVLAEPSLGFICQGECLKSLLPWLSCGVWSLGWLSSACCLGLNPRGTAEYNSGFLSVLGLRQRVTLTAGHSHWEVGSLTLLHRVTL